MRHAVIGLPRYPDFRAEVRSLVMLQDFPEELPIARLALVALPLVRLYSRDEEPVSLRASARGQVDDNGFRSRAQPR